MKKIFFFICLLAFIFSYSQELVLIKFKPKSTEYCSAYFSNPTTMLSKKALERRDKYTINLSENDVPVSSEYISAITHLGIEVVISSKWFNGVFANVYDYQKPSILALEHVTEIISLVKNPSGKKQESSDYQLPFKNQALSTDTQINQIGLNFLHESGYKGKNITIAVFDSGFPKVNTLSQFSHLRNGQIKGGYNFVEGNDNIYSQHEHGTQVLSVIGAYEAQKFTGTASEADFYLFITEKNSVEIPEEELWWVAAAEKADSIGVDIINSSLGYSTFDDSRYNYTINDLNGKTSYISRAAQIASDKGIFVITASGNDGNNSWKKISMPADAEGVLAIGAVNSQGNSASFSSYGPNADERIKPDISALGAGASYINSSGNNAIGNGTSFSTPVITGAVACLLQAHPDIHPSRLKQKIIESASLYHSPTNQQGYGIPNFQQIFKLLSAENLNTGIDNNKLFQIYPNPVSDFLNIRVNSEKSGTAHISFFNSAGKLLFTEKTIIETGDNYISIYISNLLKSHQILLMRLNTPDGKFYSHKILTK